MAQLFECKPREKAGRSAFNWLCQIFSLLPLQGSLGGGDIIVRVWRLDIVEGFRDRQRVIFKILVGFKGECEVDILWFIRVSRNLEGLKMGQELSFSTITSQVLGTSTSSMLGFSNEDSKKNSN